MPNDDLSKWLSKVGRCITYNKIFIITIAIYSLFLSGYASASEKTFIKEYIYRASDIDSKVSSRAIALEQTKRLLLEELGTYLIAETEVKNYQISKDQITALAAGIVMTTIINEKWDGNTYYLKAKIVADPQEVAKSVDAFRKDRQNSSELETTKRKVEEALQEIGKLKTAIGSSKTNTAQQKEYAKAVNVISANELYYKGFALLNDRKYKEAIDIFSRAIELNHASVEAYINRALAYNKLGLDRIAFDDLNIALSLDPRNVKTYLLHGIVCENLGWGDIAVTDYMKMTQIDSVSDAGYYHLAENYRGGRQIDEVDFQKMNDYRWNYDPDTIFLKKSIYNYKIAARLGNKKAQEYLSSINIQW